MSEHFVKSCWDSEFYGIKCLESEDQYAFYVVDGDVRPSSCLWVDKDKAKLLYDCFKKSFEIQIKYLE